MGGVEQHWACAECARKCSKIHGARSPPSPLSFFKVMLGQFKKSLIVPPKFARLLQNLVGQNFYFEILNGRRWEVKLSKVDDHLAFQQGWNDFVSHHSIQVGEILVFKHVCTSSFVVQIFGVSGCERSFFPEIIDGEMHKGCPTHCLSFHKDERKCDTCRAHCCIGDKIPAKKRKLIRTIPRESFSSPFFRCESDGDFNKRKKPAPECLFKHLREDGRKCDKSTVPCCTKDKASARKRKFIKTTSCEIPSDARGDSNDPLKSSLHNVNNSNGPQTTISVNYSELPCIAVSEDQDKGQDESQMAPPDGCANLNVSLVSKDAERGQEGTQIVPTDPCPNMNFSQVDFPELPCKLSKTGSGKEQEAFFALPSEFIPTKVGTENANKLIVEEKSSFCTNSKMSQNSYGQKGNNCSPPTAENFSHSLTEILVSPTNCLEVSWNSVQSNLSKGLSCNNSVIELPNPSLTGENLVPGEDKSATTKDSMLDKPATTNNSANYPSIPSLKCSRNIETDSSKELSCKDLVIELPNPELSTEKVMHEDRSVSAKHNILDEFTPANIASSQSMASLECSENVGDGLIFNDMATHRFLVDEEGTCYIAENSVSNSGSNSTGTNLSKSDMDGAKCKVSFAPMAKEISFHCDITPKDLLAPIFRHRNGESTNETALIDTTNNDHHALNGHLDNVGNDAPAIPEENDDLSVRDAPQHMRKMPKSQEGSNTMSGSPREYGVKHDSVSHENVEKSKPYLKEAVLKAVKTEIMDPDDLSSPNTTYFSFSLVVTTLSWHELPEPLPSNCGKRRLEKKVVLLRDPSLRVWPVLYHESLRFTGFLGGWEAFVVANNVRKGDACHFETANHMESVLQVQISRASAN
uniref:B3 domain-containing protein Os01g0905400 n=1 Tax=Anthurium amnicola TaxID=1678845 RepID=A0A1D1XE61_9ARAE